MRRACSWCFALRSTLSALNLQTAAQRGHEAPKATNGEVIRFKVCLLCV